MKKVKALQDESGHWYVIPAEMGEEFYKLMNNHGKQPALWYEFEEEFIEKFDKYRTGGDLNLVQLYAEI